MAFKVKYRTRNKLQRAIQQEISKLGLIDDGTMRSSIRISSVIGDLNQMTITINCIYYYMFQDLGATGAGAGRNVDIRANFITQKALETPKGKQFLDETVQAYIEYLQNNPKYEILDVANISITPVMTVQYNLFGDAEGKWNGIFNPPDALKIQWQEG